jgi:hypothetical protein
MYCIHRICNSILTELKLSKADALCQFTVTRRIGCDTVTLAMSERQPNTVLTQQSVESCHENIINIITKQH